MLVFVTKALFSYAAGVFKPDQLQQLGKFV